MHQIFLYSYLILATKKRSIKLPRAPPTIKDKLNWVNNESFEESYNILKIRTIAIADTNKRIKELPKGSQLKAMPGLIL